MRPTASVTWVAALFYKFNLLATASPEANKAAVDDPYDDLYQDTSYEEYQEAIAAALASSSLPWPRSPSPARPPTTKSSPRPTPYAPQEPLPALSLEAFNLTTPSSIRTTTHRHLPLDRSPPDSPKQPALPQDQPLLSFPHLALSQNPKTPRPVEADALEKPTPETTTSLSLSPTPTSAPESTPKDNGAKPSSLKANAETQTNNDPSTSDPSSPLLLLLLLLRL